MKRVIETIGDVVSSHLCSGCGACVSYCKKQAATLCHDEESGIRPLIDEERCGDCRECLSFCPGAYLDYRSLNTENTGACHEFLGPYLEIYEGYARDGKIRYNASSGGALTALSLFCLEEKRADFVLHTGMDREEPWRNKTVQSRSRRDLLEHAGSRYAPSSPCDSLGLVRECIGPAVFIGKPCDAAAVHSLRRMDAALDEKLALVLSFFCAGPPFTQATLGLLRREGIDRGSVTSIRYRGRGWPGMFTVCGKGGKPVTSLTYRESWGYLASHRRPFRCGICPDGMGDFADISCGDAWQRHSDNGDPGRSVIIVRTERGRDILSRAVSAGYLEIQPSSPDAVLSGQSLQNRRKELYGRLLAMRILSVPVPLYDGFPAHDTWRLNAISAKARIIASTLKRIAKRHYLR